MVDMNYVSAVYGILAIIVSADWFMRGRRHYRGQVQRHDETAGFVKGTAHEKGEAVHAVDSYVS